MTETIAAAPGDFDRANIRVFLIAFVVMASGLGLTDRGTSSSEFNPSTFPARLTLETTDN